MFPDGRKEPVCSTRNLPTELLDMVGMKMGDCFPGDVIQPADVSMKLLLLKTSQRAFCCCALLLMLEGPSAPELPLRSATSCHRAQRPRWSSCP